MMLELNTIYNMDCVEGLKQIPDNTINCCVTSPPYFRLRDYNVQGQIGLEDTPEAYIEKLLNVFSEVKRVLRDDGLLWLNIGDSYAGGKIGRFDSGDSGKFGGPILGFRYNSIPQGIKQKDLIGIPWMIAFALRADGWYLRQDNIWFKSNAMPESVKDRCTKAHEYMFLLTKSARYYFDHDAMLEEATGYDRRKDTVLKGGKKYHAKRRERWQYKNLQPKGQTPNSIHLSRLAGEEYLSPVRNKRSVWIVPNKPFKGDHFATFPEKLIEPCILAGCPEGGIVLDPFMGAGTTALVARNNNRNYIGFELNQDYIDIAEARLKSKEAMLQTSMLKQGDF